MRRVRYSNVTYVLAISIDGNVSSQVVRFDNVVIIFAFHPIHVGFFSDIVALRPHASTPRAWLVSVKRGIRIRSATPAGRRRFALALACRRQRHPAFGSSNCAGSSLALALGLSVQNSTAAMLHNLRSGVKAIDGITDGARTRRLLVFFLRGRRFERLANPFKVLQFLGASSR